jgi:hypothetical protein
LAKLSDAAAVEHPELANCRFTAHDFRRLFATDLVNHGLAIHISAALLGHLAVQTTHGYVTVLLEDAIRHYQAHLAGRRADRPAREYRAATATKWDEFEEHFDKRKIELIIERLDEINNDLITRRGLAETKGWLGELECIDLTLRFLRDKRADAQRLARRGPTSLGMPSLGI